MAPALLALAQLLAQLLALLGAEPGAIRVVVARLAARVGLARPPPAFGSPAILLPQILPQPLAIGLVHARVCLCSERPRGEREQRERERRAPAACCSACKTIHGGILGPTTGGRNAPAGKRCNNR